VEVMFEGPHHPLNPDGFKVSFGVSSQFAMNSFLENYFSLRTIKSVHSEEDSSLLCNSHIPHLIWVANSKFNQDSY
jgi:hypothetical protein